MSAARLREVAIRLGALVGLAVSAMLLANVVGHVALFCGPEGGCSAVQHSEWAKPFGIPMPYLGLGFFGVALVLALRPRARAGRWLTLWASGGALTSLILLGLQLFVIGEVCPLCLVVDLSGVALGALAQKYSGDFDAFRTTLFGLGQQGPLTSVGRRARLTTEGLRANFSPLQLIIAPPLALLGL